MKIVSIPQPVLYSISKPITKFDNKLKEIVTNMEILLDKQNDPPGVGLAAPQVDLPIQLFIVKINPKDTMQVFINAKILEVTEEKKGKKVVKKEVVQFEGCLSIPRIWGEVARPKKIKVEYQTETGELKQEWFTGFRATVIQHEIDHLNGILFTQRVLEQHQSLYEEKDGELEKMKELI